MIKDVEIFKGTNFSDLLQEIHATTNKKSNRIDSLISELRGLMQTAEDAAVIAPIVAKFLEVMVTNDDHLVKMAAIIQRIISADTKNNKGGGIEDLLSDAEKQKLLEDAKKELEEVAQDLEKLETMKVPTTAGKENDVQSTD